MTILYVALACITVGAFIGWTLHIIATDIAARRNLPAPGFADTFREFTEDHPAMREWGDYTWQDS